MEKYRLVRKPKDTSPKDDEEIRVTAAGSVSAYVGRAAKVFGELEKKEIIIKATGNALSKAVTTGEVVKRRIAGLHQITSLSIQDIEDEYEPIEEGLDKVTQTRSITVIEIKLSKEPLDTSDKGYQAPIDAALVTEVDPEEMTRARGRGRGKGRGKGKGSSKGKGKGKGKSKDKGKEKGKGKGKGKEKGEEKGKSKGKGKGKGKEEGKGKGKGKGKEPVGSGKPSKGSGKKGEKGKGKGKSESYPPLGGKSGGKKGKSKWEDDYSYGKGSSKGKGKSSAWGKGDSYGSYGKGKDKGKSKGKGKSKSWDSWW